MTPRSDWPLRTAPLVFFDLETTALRPDRGGRICEMAVVDAEGSAPHHRTRSAARINLLTMSK